jgi:hypothetical protein
MLDKSVTPDEAAILAHMGKPSFGRLQKMAANLSEAYDLVQELKFPFGNEYGWGYKFGHKKTHLCYTFFEPEGFTVMLQIPGKQVSAVEEILPSLLPKTRDYWVNRYPCGENGGWIHYQEESDAELSDVLKLIHVKKKPIKRNEQK